MKTSYLPLKRVDVTLQLLALLVCCSAAGCAAQKQTNTPTVDDGFQPTQIISSAKSELTELYEKTTQNTPIQKGVKAADTVIIDSHVIGVAKRPVSSAYRLFAWTKGTAIDIIKPDVKIPIFRSDDIPQSFDFTYGMDLDAFEKRLDKITGEKQSSGTMKFLIGGEEFFPRMEQAILSAQKSIDVRIFIFDNDDYGVRVADFLKQKSAEGVKVRVLLDGVGQLMGEGKRSDTLPEGFVSPSSMVSYLKQDSDIEVREKPNPWLKADHTKTIIIDEDIMFTGGMNIGREYRYDWHDMMVEVQGPMTKIMLQEFELAWKHSGYLGDLAYLKGLFDREAVETNEDLPPIRPLFTRANDPQIFNAQLEAIRSAREYIYISNAYFSDETIINALIDARKRGVDARIILPSEGNHEIMNKNNVIAANKMFEAGIRIYFYPGMSHIKAAIYDGWMTTGSANFDKLSFRDNLEFNIATSDLETVERFKERLFVKDMEKSVEMTHKLDSGITEYLMEIIAEQL